MLASQEVVLHISVNTHKIHTPFVQMLISEPWRDLLDRQISEGMSKSVMSSAALSVCTQDGTMSDCIPIS